MSRGRVLVSALVLLAILAVALLRDRPPAVAAPPRPVRATLAAATPGVAPTGHRSQRRPAVLVRRADEPSASTVRRPVDDVSALAALAEIPTAEELPAGLAPSYRDAVARAQVALLRARRRCSLELPDVAQDLEWDAVETFEPDGTGGAPSVSVEIIPATPGPSAFFDCLAEETVGLVDLRLAEAIDAPIRVRSPGRMIREPDMTPDAILEAVAELRHRVAIARREVDRELLADHLALWECYARRGAHQRRACIEESLRQP